MLNYNVVENSILIMPEKNSVSTDNLISAIRLLSKLAPVRKVGGGSEHRTAVYTPVHEDSSTEPTNKFSAGVEFGKKSIIEASDVCVRCGLCLPHCPTYQIAEIEPESPRGRIVMAKALAERKIPLTASMQTHLNNCLSCLACEAMCPAKVPYHDLIVATRALQAKTQKPVIPFFLNLLLAHPRLTIWLQRLFKFYQKSGLAWAMKHSGLSKLTGLEHYSAFMPKHLKFAKFRSHYAVANPKASVALFTGCINSLCDSKTIFHAIKLLNQLNYDVFVPKAQKCCGAIHLHSGLIQRANDLLQQNAAIFSGPLAKRSNISAILTLATGCYSSLSKLKNFPDINLPIMDINEFLLGALGASSEEINTANRLHSKLVPAKILIHTPCTLKNSIKRPNLILDVLKKAGFTNLSLLQGYGCCGAAGLNMWNNPELAKSLAKPIIEQISVEKPDYVVTANIGCQLHLQKLLQEIGLHVEILHPLNLIFTEKT